jgi:hypothetical protein
MSSLMTDMLGEKVSPDIGNAVCNAGGKLLKVVELQFRYGRADSDGERQLMLAMHNRKSAKTIEPARR